MVEILLSGNMETLYFILTNLNHPARIADIRNNKDKTALFYVRNPKQMYLLLNYGADPTVGRAENFSLLEEYVHTNPSLAKALLNHELGTNNHDVSDKQFQYVYKLRLLLQDTTIQEKDDKGMFKFITFSTSVIGIPNQVSLN